MADDFQNAPTHLQRALKWAIFLGATALIAYLCLLILRPFLDVLAWSSILAVAFHPLYARLVRKTGRPGLSALICSVAVVMAILIPVLLITGLAINQFLALREYLQHAFENGLDVTAMEPLHRVSEWLTRRLGLDAKMVLGWLTQHASELGRATAGYSLTLAANVTGLVVSIVFTIFAMFLLFRDGERMVARLPDLLPFPRTRSQAMLVRIRDVINASVYGVLVIAVIQGALCGAMFGVLGIPSAALWGMVTVLTSVLPLVGAAAVWVPGTLYLLVTGHWPQAVILAVWGTAVISSVDNFLRPRLVGGRVGLSELVTFFALLGGLQVFGILGIVLGPVLFAIAASMLNTLAEEESTP